MAETNVKEFLGLERKFWKAMQEGDGDACMALTDDSCIVTGPQGSARIDRAGLGKMMKAPTYKIERFEVKDDAEVLMLGGDVAVVAYKVHEELVVEGKPVKLDAADTSTWVRRDGRWVCAAHTETLLGDPFGRDRKGA